MQSSAIWLKRWVYEWWVISRVSYITYPPVSLTLHTARSIEVDYIVYFWHRSVAPLFTVWRLSYFKKKKKTVPCSEGTRSCLGLLTLHVHTLLSLVICCRGIFTVPHCIGYAYADRDSIVSFSTFHWFTFTLWIRVLH